MSVRGTDLRYLLVWMLWDEGPCGVSELVDRLASFGFGVDGRPSKTISDALRWEVRRGRLMRPYRDWYMLGDIPRSTEYRIHKRVLRLRVQAGTLSEDRAALYLL
ncbi:hypothetical protein ACWDUN_18210 [Mycobacterium sp. NPDC003323]